MPRISEERRSANRQAILDAARRCFARDGFHQTSMPDLLAEAGISAGAFYRYFGGKEELIHEIAREGFAAVGGAVMSRLDEHPGPSVADVVALVADTLALSALPVDGRTIATATQARVMISAWSEVLRDDALATEVRAGVGGVLGGIAAALERGRAAGRVPAALDARDGAQMIIALLPGMVLQQAALGMDPRAVGRAAQALTDGPV